MKTFGMAASERTGVYILVGALCVWIVGACMVVLYYRSFGERSVPMPVVSEVTGLDFPDSSVLTASSYQPYPRGYLVARVEMPGQDLPEFTQQQLLQKGHWEEDAARALLNFPMETPSIDNRDPSTVAAPTLISVSIPERGKQRFLRLLISGEPTESSIVLIWSIVD